MADITNPSSTSAKSYTDFGALGELRGPMREETNSWLNRVALGVKTQHATAREGHNRLMLTKAIDLSARRGRPVDARVPAPADRARPDAVRMTRGA